MPLLIAVGDDAIGDRDGDCSDKSMRDLIGMKIGWSKSASVMWDRGTAISGVLIEDHAKLTQL